MDLCEKDSARWKQVLAAIPPENWTAAFRILHITGLALSLSQTEPELGGAVYKLEDLCRGLASRGQVLSWQERKQEVEAIWNLRESLQGVWWLGMRQPWRTALRQVGARLTTMAATQAPPDEGVDPR